MSSTAGHCLNILNVRLVLGKTLKNCVLHEVFCSQRSRIELRHEDISKRPMLYLNEDPRFLFKEYNGKICTFNFNLLGLPLEAKLWGVLFFIKVFCSQFPNWIEAWRRLERTDAVPQWRSQFSLQGVYGKIYTFNFILLGLPLEMQHLIFEGVR